MKKRGLIIVIIVILVLILGYFGIDHFIKNRIGSLPIKSLTEEKLGSLLGAKVSIEEMKFGLIKQLSLSGLRIDPKETEEQGFYFYRLWCFRQGGAGPERDRTVCRPEGRRDRTRCDRFPHMP